MSNTLTITVGNFSFEDENKVIILASDAYASTFFLFDTSKDFIEKYPSENDLILYVLDDITFEDGANIKDDNTYELLSIDKIQVNGYTNLLKNEKN